MKKINLGNSGIKVSKLGLGTWAIGGGPAWNGDIDQKICVNTMCEAVNVGINLMDTAPAYNFGNSELMVGAALKELNRKEVIIETKCGIVWDKKGSLFNKVGDIQLYKNLTPDSIRQELEQSLSRLGTDYVDIYMTHWQSVEPYFTPISETMATLNALKEEGKIKAIGVSNVNIGHIEEYLKHGDLDIVQCKYSILDREVEEKIIPICKQNNIVLQAYSPLEQGLLTGTITKDYVPTGARANKKWFQRENMYKVIDMLEQWKPICKKYNCTIPTLALAWVMAQGDYITVLTGATSADEVRENVKAANLELETIDIEMMREMVNKLES